MSKVTDYDSHFRILNFLIYIQSIGIINETQRLYYSDYIQDYLNERQSNLDFMESILKELK